jgi:hypothetical protein
VEDQGVAIGISERREVADPGIPGLRDELDPLRFEFSSRRGNVSHSQCKSGLVATKDSFSRSGSQKLRVTFGVSTSPFVASLPGSPKTSRYQAIARAALRVGTEMKSTSSTCTAPC